MLKKKQAVINVDCESHCFKYAVLSILHYDDISVNRHRTVKYSQWTDELNFEGCNVDNMKLKDIEKFEKLNKIKIIVHIWQNGLKGVRYNKINSCYDRVVNLLLVYENENWHYCGIPKISRLYYHTLSKCHSHFVCDRCTHSFKSKDKFETYYEGTSQIGLKKKVSLEKF